MRRLSLILLRLDERISHGGRSHGVKGLCENVGALELIAGANRLRGKMKLTRRSFELIA